MRSSLILVVIAFGASAAALFAQSANTPAVPSSNGPVEVKRVPAANRPVDAKNASTVLSSASGNGQAVVDNGVPKDYRPKEDIALTPNAEEAVRVSAQWQGEKNAPAAGPDGRVMYSFGAGLPTVVCAPLRICMIELQAGERILGEPQIGDSVRWIISPATYGTGEQTTPVIVLKPQTPGLDTNLLVTTDHRAYYLRLISKADDYVARVAFAYPDDESSQKWQKQIAAQRAIATQEQRTAELPPAMITVEKMNFSYRLSGGDDHLRPLRVFDDGTRTYIQMPPEIQNREAPVLLVVGKDGKSEITNYRVKDQTYIVDRLFDRATLVLGSGKKAQKVEIIRGTKG